MKATQAKHGFQCADRVSKRNREPSSEADIFWPGKFYKYLLESKVNLNFVDLPDNKRKGKKKKICI